MARITIASLTARLDAADAANASMEQEIVRLRRQLVQQDRAVKAEPAAPAAEHAACKRKGCVNGRYILNGEDCGACFRCDGTGIDPGVVAGRTQFRARRRQAAMQQPARSNSGAPRSSMADAARRYCAEHGVASCTVEQARSMLAA